jgi:hypothetical protein
MNWQTLFGVTIAVAVSFLVGRYVSNAPSAEDLVARINLVMSEMNSLVEVDWVFPDDASLSYWDGGTKRVVFSGYSIEMISDAMGILTRLGKYNVHRRPSIFSWSIHPIAEVKLSKLSSPSASPATTRVEERSIIGEALRTAEEMSKKVHWFFGQSHLLFGDLRSRFTPKEKKPEK